MQENKKNASTNEFLTVFGMKIVDGEHYNSKDDTVDPRAPVNSPELLYEQFVVDDQIMDELDAENIDDFDEDIYPYEDRSEMGEDIAAMSRLDLKKSQEKLRKAQEDYDAKKMAELDDIKLRKKSAKKTDPEPEDAAD